MARAAWQASDAEIAALLEGRHGDPFALLGPHGVAAGTVVRAFVPHAETLRVAPRDGGAAVAMTRRHDAGFFEGLLKRPDWFDYALAAENTGGTWEIQDPFRYGPVLGPLPHRTHRRRR